MTPRASLKTDNRNRFLEFNLLLKNKLMLNVYSYFRGEDARSFEYDNNCLCLSGNVCEAAERMLVKPGWPLGFSRTLGCMSNIAILLENGIHEGHFSSWQGVGQNMFFKMQYNKHKVKLFSFMHFHEMLYDPI